ncbi:MAG: hypothetical protein K0R38_7917 [Polyangiaceae bacterium]|nr:hypothetical protein [Polyangiaceae bacterium]
MKEKRILRTLLATALLAAFNLSALAQVVQEAEPVGTIGANDAVATAQHLPIGSSGSVTVSGAIGHATGTATALKDVDFYTFDGMPGWQRVTIPTPGTKVQITYATPASTRRYCQQTGSIWSQ